jgi:hypothetical protein
VVGCSQHTTKQRNATPHLVLPGARQGGLEVGGVLRLVKQGVKLLWQDVHAAVGQGGVTQGHPHLHRATQPHVGALQRLLLHIRRDNCHLWVLGHIHPHPSTPPPNLKKLLTKWGMGRGGECLSGSRGHTKGSAWHGSSAVYGR